MTPDQADNLLALATRNAMILKWLRDLSSRPLLAALVEREYAEFTGFQLDDVKDALEYATDATSLNWLWGRYGSDIEDSDFLRT